MALINCPECNKQISDRAVTCPSCGCPVAAQPTETAYGSKVQTIEATGKKWKSLELVAAMALIISVVGVITSAHYESGLATMFFFLLFFAGLGILIFAKVGAWWHHQ